MPKELNDTSYLIRYKLIIPGSPIVEGSTFGSKAWLDNERYGNQNAIKRVKSDLGIKWSEKTTELVAIAGEDMVRRFDDGRVLHIWIERNGSPKPGKAVKASDTPATPIETPAATLERMVDVFARGVLIDHDPLDVVSWLGILDGMGVSTTPAKLEALVKYRIELLSLLE